MLWRGCWWAFDQYFFSNNPLLSHMLCIFIPLIIGTIWAVVAGYKFTWQVDWNTIVNK
jgi:hypothetical protein